MNSWQDHILAGPHINQVLTFLQDHILAAMITTQKSLPCLQEMVHNYLSEARLRSWEDDYGLDEGLGRDGLDHDSCDRFEKDRGMKVLQAEERKRREGRECVSPTCRCF